MRGRGGRAVALAGAALLAFVAIPARAEEPEVIVLDPNHPIIQNPGTVQPPAQGTPAPSRGSGAPELVSLQEGVNAREVLADLWFKERALKQRGENAEASRLIETALDFMKREGLRGAPQIAGAFLDEARRSLEQSDYRRAQENFRLASRFDPAMAPAHLGLALALLRGDRDLTGAFQELWTAARTWAGDAGSVYSQSGNVVLIVYLGLFFGLTAALLLCSLHVSPAFFHDLKERFPRSLSEEWSRLLGWALLALPILLLAPFVWLLAAWAALLFPYFKRAEKTLALLLLVLLAGAGLFGGVLDWISGTAVDSGARALLRSLRGGYDVQDEKALEHLAAEYPDDPMFPFILASMHRTAGRFDEAIRLYTHVLEIDRTHVRAMVNLGNLHALRQEFSIAQNLYKQAGDLDPKLAIAHYNSHLAHLEAFHLESADQELKTARRIDDALVTMLLAQGNEGSARRTPSDVGYTRAEIWRRALSLRWSPAVRSVGSVALSAPGTVAGVVGLLGALLLPGLGIAPRTSPARRCRRCGRPFCRRCSVRTKDPDHCSQCVHLYILRDGLAPNVKNRKMAEVVRYRRRVWVGERVLSLVCPGGGHVLGGRSFVGTFLLACWCGLWLTFVLRGQLLVPSDLLAATDLGVVVMTGTLALFVWLVGNLSSHEAERE
jgi:tetratricopeptide (TPR) repeat protein